MWPLSLRLRGRWVLSALSRNPLVRFSDRAEVGSVLLVFVVAFLAIPFARQHGSDAYDARLRMIDQQLHTRHAVEAVVVVSNVAASGRFNRSGSVRAEWHVGSQIRSAKVGSSAMASEGSKISVWLNDADQVVTPPETPQMAKLVANNWTWALWTDAVGAAILAAIALRLMLDRYRARRWEHELLVLAHNDDGWANQDG